MYELVKAAENSYYMDCPTKVGIIKTGANEVVLIDSGSDKDAAKKVKKILDAQGWTIKAIYNTHSHADHTGGNQFFQNLTGCRIYAPGIDCAVTNNPILEPVMLYGGNTMKELHNKFLLAKESKAEELTQEVLPEGIELIKLPGHSYDMVGFRSKDNVVYLADCLSSEETLEKYKIGFLYDVQAYIDTLEMVKTLEAESFIPAHAPEVKDIVPLAQLNIDKTIEVADRIESILIEPADFDSLLAKVFDYYSLTMNLSQRMLVGSTVKSYLTYLLNKGTVEFFFEKNMMLWRKN